jgi:putative flippase GtrA
MKSARLLLNNRVTRFIFVGSLNTILDYLIFNLLIFLFSLKPVEANFISTSCALGFSYFLNKRLVFKHQGIIDKRSAILFIAFTLFGIWVIQGGLIYLIVNWVQHTQPNLYAAHKLIVPDIAKIFATGASLIWNFTSYNLFVFRDPRSETSK